LHATQAAVACVRTDEKSTFGNTTRFLEVYGRFTMVADASSFVMKMREASRYFWNLPRHSVAEVARARIM